MPKRLLGILVMPFVAVVALIPAPKSLFYHDRRPTRLGRTINRTWTWVAGAGMTPYSWPGQPHGGTIALETKGRRSGAIREHVVTWVQFGSDRYLVSMLGERSDWVRNARAAGGEAWIRHGGRKSIHLEDVRIEQRGPILQAYLKRTAMSTAYHLGVKPDAPIEDFERIAPDHPVFRIVQAGE